MKKIAIYLAVFALAALGGGMAHAHTTSIGFVSAGTPGSVTFWTGSYHFNTLNEGDLTLAGINGNSFASTTLAFDLLPPVQGVKPVGLVDGTSNFYWTTPNFSGPLDKSLTSDPGVLGGVRSWQGVTFAGLTAGDYSFTCGATCGSTFRWNSWSNGNGTLTLTGAVVGNPAPVPEPGTIVLMASGLIGLAIWGRKKGIAAKS